jgi:hypothetical protein
VRVNGRGTVKDVLRFWSVRAVLQLQTREARQGQKSFIFNARMCQAPVAPPPNGTELVLKPCHLERGGGRWTTCNAGSNIFRRTKIVPIYFLIQHRHFFFSKIYHLHRHCSKFGTKYLSTFTYVAPLYHIILPFSMPVLWTSHIIHSKALVTTYTKIDQRLFP